MEIRRAYPAYWQKKAAHLEAFSLWSRDSVQRRDVLGNCMRFQLGEFRCNGVHDRVIVGSLTLVELFQLILDITRMLAS